MGAREDILQYAAAVTGAMGARCECYSVGIAATALFSAVKFSW